MNYLNPDNKPLAWDVGQELFIILPGSAI